MKTYFIVADVHSFYDEMIAALEREKFDINNPEHIFVSLGDLLDRGPKPVECVRFVNSLPAERKILIRGNHDDLLVEALTRGEFYVHDIRNRTHETIRAFTTEPYDEWMMCQEAKNNIELQQYLNSLIDYYEDDKNVFVHGWIPCEKTSGDSLWLPIENWRNANWSQARWINGMRAWHDGVRVQGKTIWCGHWHASYGHSIIEGLCHEFGDDAMFTPFEADGIVAMDACTVYSGYVNCKTISV